MKKRTVIIDEINSTELFQKLREIIMDIHKKQQPSTEQSSKLLSIKEVSEYFGVSKRTINNWCKNSILYPISVGRRIYFEESQVRNLVHRNKITEKKI